VRKYPLSITQDHFSIEGRGLVREATLEHYREDNEFVKKIAGDDELPPQLPSIYRHPPLQSAQQWGMTIDLNTCNWLQRLCHRMPGGEQCPGRWQTGGRPWPGDALAADRSLFRE